MGTLWTSWAWMQASEMGSITCTSAMLSPSAGAVLNRFRCHTADDICYQHALRVGLSLIHPPIIVCICNAHCACHMPCERTVCPSHAMPLLLYNVQASYQGSAAPFPPLVRVSIVLGACALRVRKRAECARACTAAYLHCMHLMHTKCLLECCPCMTTSNRLQ